MFCHSIPFYFVLAGVLFKLYNKLTTRWCKSQVCLKGKTAIVTGANTGIGYETAIDLAKRGARVILACRSEARAEEARDKIIRETLNNDVIYKIVDFGSLKSVRAFADDIKSTEERLDILVNNAGVEYAGDQVSEDGLLLIMQINYFGPVLVTHLLLGMLKETAGRIVNVSGLAGKTVVLTLEDTRNLNQFIGRWPQYCRTKLCNILFTVQLAQKLQGTGVTTYSLHPGLILTEFGRHSSSFFAPIFFTALKIFGKTPREGAQTSIHCAVTSGLEIHNGQHFAECRVVDKYPSASDPELARRLWDETFNILKI